MGVGIWLEAGDQVMKTGGWRYKNWEVDRGRVRNGENCHKCGKRTRGRRRKK
jgi:hypothetical protein